MRQLLVQVPLGQGKKVLEIAQAHEGSNLSQFEAMSPNGLIDEVIVHLSNRKIEDFLKALDDIADVHITLTPQGVMALKPPSSQAAEEVKEVQELSPIEIFLEGLQSVGSWRGFLGYAAMAGIVVWIGLLTNKSYLLVAAMLIAPFAGPAMNAALATARGDWQLLRRSLLRYFVALGVTIAVCALLSWIFRQQIATAQMISISEISEVAVLLPLAAGTAGALNLVQSKRSSLVSGAATGMLVAASLAPPAGLIGIGSVLGRWDMTKSGLFLLLLQLVGINLSGAIIFRMYGLSARGARYKRGKKSVTIVTLIITTVILVSLIIFQFRDSPTLQRATRSQRATATIHQVIEKSQEVDLVEANVRFTRANIPNQDTLLAVVYVQPHTNLVQSKEQLQTELTQKIQNQLQQQFKATPLVNLTILEPPVSQP
ncbi:TIGR00341 family protein [Gloeothece verrucosa]|uniref:TIGR00341 family protein n=1 Tax=Gloeothece verrucosa (strain PCC 7822) TaxID=497965 RepID=E0ULV4_GLOV7|nr:TIGR00341 family protein [Gloeothece verrucosa]ADN17934.1 conserved hypothetical protein [Gloeothece verrucosa PCC 7822]